MLTLSLPHWLLRLMTSALREGDDRTHVSCILAVRGTKVLGSTFVLWSLPGIIFIHFFWHVLPLALPTLVDRSQFTTCAVFYIHGVLSLWSSCPPDWAYPAPKAAVLWWPVTEHWWGVYSAASSTTLCLYSQGPCYHPTVPVLLFSF